MVPYSSRLMGTSPVHGVRESPSGRGCSRLVGDPPLHGGWIRRLSVHRRQHRMDSGGGTFLLPRLPSPRRSGRGACATQSSPPSPPLSSRPAKPLEGLAAGG